MANRDLIMGYLFGRRGFTRWTGRERTRPKMPSGRWRAAAVSCTAIGVLAAWLLFRSSGGVGWRMVAGGLIGLVVGMYVVETIWERRLAQQARSGPFGSRNTDR